MAMTVWSWLWLTAGPWLLGTTIRWTRWLLLAVAALAAWPVTLVAGAGYLTAWLRGWPAAKLYQAAAWALPVTAAGLVMLEVRTPGWMTARTPGRGGARGWDHLAAADLARVFLLLAPVTVPAGLALAGLIWAWRISVVGGLTACASVSFGTRRRKRQIRIQRGSAADPDLIGHPRAGQSGDIGGDGAMSLRVARPEAAPLTPLPTPAAGPPVQVPEPRREPAAVPAAWPHTPVAPMTSPDREPRDEP
jgi:hypothetical protein